VVLNRAGVLALVVAFVAGGLLGLLVRGGDRQVRALQAYADSLRQADSTDVVAALAFAASERRRADSIQAAKVPVRVVTRRDGVTVDALRQAVQAAQTAGDSLALLVDEVATLEHQVAAYEDLRDADSLTLLAERARGDRLELTVRDLDDSNAKLTARIQKLRPMPKLARVGLEVVKLGVVGYAGFKAGQASANR
jgi:hypothetical protein